MLLGMSAPKRPLMLLLLPALLQLGMPIVATEEQREAWWDAGHTQFSLWDHSWLTPRMICGIRFARVPGEAGREGSVWLPLESLGAGMDEVLAATRHDSRPTDGESASAASPREMPPILMWNFDGTAFQFRAMDYYQGRGPPPMQDVWMIILLAAVPASMRRDVMSGAAMLEFSCGAVTVLSQYLYAEYMAPVVPPAVLLKFFKHTWEVHSRSGTPESAQEIAEHLEFLAPLPTAKERFQAVLGARREANFCAMQGRGSAACESAVQSSTEDSGVPVSRPLVDIVIARCREDLRWLLDWLTRVLRDEWTPEVPGLRLRILIFERCESIAEEEDSQKDAPGSSTAPAKPPLAGRPLVDKLLRIGAIDPGSEAISLPEPLGFENIAYVHYCKTMAWRNADFAIFLHGSPFDHLNGQTLDDVMRSMAQGTYGVAFLHLNTRRTPLVAMEPCLAELLRPVLQAAGVRELPTEMSTYCCSQFVVARQRLDRVPVSFWEDVWRSLHFRTSVQGTAVQELGQSCRLPARRIYDSHHRHGSSPVADYGLWAVVLERSWHWIFGEEPNLPIREFDQRLPLFLRVPRSRTDTEGGPRGSVQDRVSMPDWGYDPGYWGLPPIVGNATGEATTLKFEPVPTRHYAANARPFWQLPPWVDAWFKEDEQEEKLVS
ncbi:unnamed protein product [Polarella glacialis]|uniref:Uncharacterized protein n=1 Tax=Polarella glacialis TaxID=89957 RepID=A0A813EBE6_POLGL|nr:unnamed protein product [Polarella glacialis]CAE8681048.1 unnamed protein product [Polarella glacialis]